MLSDPCGSAQHPSRRRDLPLQVCSTGGCCHGLELMDPHGPLTSVSSCGPHSQHRFFGVSSVCPGWVGDKAVLQGADFGFGLAAGVRAERCVGKSLGWAFLSPPPPEDSMHTLV